MINRILFEWGSLPYGDAPDAIPHWAADRLAAVAAGSPLGAQVLELRRHDIRAGQIVGVVAAADCTLEILPKIDFSGEANASPGRIREQLVHMLAVALDLDIATGRMTALGTQRENLLEVLIGLFAGKLIDAVRQGMPRRYVRQEEDLPTLRGRLDVQRQFTTLAASPQRLACRYDELSIDIPLNQIMKAAVARLAKLSRSTTNQRLLRELGAVYVDIDTVPVRALRWNDIVLDRTNRRWSSLLDLAKLLLGDRFQTTSTGSSPGFSLLFEMNVLFEAYVARMLARACARTGLTVVTQGGRLFCLRDEEGVQRFQTKPDILIKRGVETLMVVDTKWKRLVDRVEDPKQGVSQSDVYQMMAYGRLYRCPRLMLLYPHHAGLRLPAPLQNRHSLAPAYDETLTISSIDVQSNAAALSCLRDSLSTSNFA